MTKIQQKAATSVFLDFTLVEGVAVCVPAAESFSGTDGDEAEILDAVETNNKEVCLQSALWCHYYYFFYSPRYYTWQIHQGSAVVITIHGSPKFFFNRVADVGKPC